MKILYSLGILTLLFLNYSCNPDDLKADIPAYLTIEDVSVLTTVELGSGSDNITDVKVFINDQSLGTFELPASIPIRNTGKVNLKIQAVIPVNGQSSEKKSYPFYANYEVDTTLIPEVEYKINPQLSYFSTAILHDEWSGEDFTSGVNFQPNPDSDTTLVRVTGEETFEGASGLAYLTADQQFFETWSQVLVNVPKDGSSVYLEFDYKSTHDIAIQILVNGQSLKVPITFFKSRTTYGKIYINLLPVFGTYNTAINFNLAFTMFKQKGTIGSFYLDNVKLVRFK